MSIIRVRGVNSNGILNTVSGDINNIYVQRSFDSFLDIIILYICYGPSERLVIVRNARSTCTVPYLYVQSKKILLIFNFVRSFFYTMPEYSRTM